MFDFILNGLTNIVNNVNEFLKQFIKTPKKICKKIKKELYTLYLKEVPIATYNSYEKAENIRNFYDYKALKIVCNSI